MKVYFGSDHAGFELKQKLFSYVQELGYNAIDCGAKTLDPQDDYPELIRSAVRMVANDPGEDRAIILGGSGQGEAIVANRSPHIRAVVYYGGPIDIIRLSREHNNANVLSLGARFLTDDEAKEAVSLWLTTAFTQEERHLRRIEHIDRP